MKSAVTCCHYIHSYKVRLLKDMGFVIIKEFGKICRLVSSLTSVHYLTIHSKVFKVALIYVKGAVARGQDCGLMYLD